MYNTLVKQMPPQPGGMAHTSLNIGQLAWGYESQKGLFIRTPGGMVFLGTGVLYTYGLYYPLPEGETVALTAGGVR